MKIIKIIILFCILLGCNNSKKGYLDIINKYYDGHFKIAKNVFVKYQDDFYNKRNLNKDQLEIYKKYITELTPLYNINSEIIDNLVTYNEFLLISNHILDSLEKVQSKDFYIINKELNDRSNSIINYLSYLIEEEYKK